MKRSRQESAASELRCQRLAADALAGRWAPLPALRGDARGEFLEWIAERRLAALLLHVCGDALADDAVGDDLAIVARRDVVVSALQEREVRRLLTAFDAVGVELVLLKGTALAHGLYPEPGLRPRRDVDFAIRERDRPTVHRVLGELGYSPELDTPGSLISSQCHYVATDASGLPHACDVHLRLSNSHPYADVLTADALWRDAVPLARLHPAARGPSPPHALLIACIHRVAHHYDAADLIWLWDIHLLAQALTDRQWEQLLALSHSGEVSAVVQRGLERTRDTLGDATCGTRTEAFARAAMQEHGRPLFGPETRTLDVFTADWRALSSARARLRLLREHLFPAMSFIHDRYPSCPAPLLPLAYVYRIIRGAPKWLARRGPQ